MGKVSLPLLMPLLRSRPQLLLWKEARTLGSDPWPLNKPENLPTLFTLWHQIRATSSHIPTTMQVFSTLLSILLELDLTTLLLLALLRQHKPPNQPVELISLPINLPISLLTNLLTSLPISLPISPPINLPISLPTSLPTSLPISLEALHQQPVLI